MQAGRHTGDKTYKEDGTKVCDHERPDDSGGKTFKLSKDIVGPSTSKGFKESDQNHDKVDVKVDRAQKVQTGVHAVNERKNESNYGQSHGKPKARYLFEEFCCVMLLEEDHVSKCMTRRQRRQ